MKNRKKIKTSSKLLVGLFLSILLAITIFAIYVAKHSDSNKWQESNVLATNERKLEAFHQIESSDGISIEFTQDGVQKVVVSADSSLLPFVMSEVKDGKLILHRTDSNHSGTVIVKITADSINNLDLSAGSFFKSMGVMKGYALEASASSGASFEANLNFTKLKFDFSSGGSGEAKGNTNLLEAEVSSGSSFNANELIAASVTASASSGGNMEVNATGDISVDASSGGSIVYSGNPTLKTININSGGNFTKK